jgi:integrase
MKMRRLHIVPLSTQAVALLTELKGITGAGRWLFPNHRRPHDVMSATTVNHALMGLGFASATVTAHDFRATASTRLHEMGVRSDFIELQLAHVERNRVRAAYNHADYLAERAAMMKTWADWLDAVAAENPGAQNVKG